ncbi:MAG TPA: hypothetical protein VIO39_07175 [Methylotenera sp.]
MNEIENFYRTQDGKIVFMASTGVGEDNSFSCSHLHGYRDNGFPTHAPAGKVEKNIWELFVGMPKHATV